MTKTYEDKLYVETLVMEVAEKLDRVAEEAGLEAKRTYVQDLKQRFHPMYRLFAEEFDLTTERAEELQSIQEQYDKIVDTLENPEDQWFASELQFENIWDNAVPNELSSPEKRMSLVGPQWFMFCKELIRFAVTLKLTDAENAENVLRESATA